MKIDFSSLAKRIEQRLLEYVAVRSDTNTPLERNIEGFWADWARGLDYFKENPRFWGMYPIKGDALNRHVCWALRRGEGADTVVLIHHSDCVETAEYADLEDAALSPRLLAERLKKTSLPHDALADLESGLWMFGRGVNDMKGGGAIQMALVEEYCKTPDFKGNVLILALPDEEHLSAGMLSAIGLLRQLKEEHGLNYKLMIDSEAHERDNPQNPVIYTGSVGKVMPIIYVRGRLAHVGQVLSGVNPLGVLSEIISQTELAPCFVEQRGNTVSPPPTWLFGKDTKPGYDVSLPLAAWGYMNVLTLGQNPMEVMAKVKDLALKGADSFVEKIRKAASHARSLGAPADGFTPPNIRVMDFSQLFDEAARDSGDVFKAAYAEALKQAGEGISAGRISMADGGKALIETALAHISDLSPVVVLAMAPPYYPGVSLEALPRDQADFADKIIDSAAEFLRESSDAEPQIKSFYTGISDLSYATASIGRGPREYIEANMLLWGDSYFIPFDEIEKISMPVINIGPWGKDIHKFTERAYISDLFFGTPALLNNAILTALEKK